MTRRSRRGEATAGEKVWVGAIGLGLVILIMVLYALMSKGPDKQALSEITLKGQAVPRWSGQIAKPSPSVETSGNIEIHIDTSLPMAGFMPPKSAPDTFSGFRAMLPILHEQLAVAFDQTKDNTNHFKVDREVEALKGGSSVDRDLLEGKETRLDKSIQQILKRLRNGEIEAAALVTDLIATGELTGAVGSVGKALDDWLGSPEVRSGQFDIGILGIRSTYWGVVTKRRQICAVERSGLGCWLSERGQRWVPLEKTIQMPFYILIFGRAEGEVNELGKNLEEAAQGLGLEAHWVLTTRNSEALGLNFTCRLHQPGEERGERQYALEVYSDGTFECIRSEKAQLSCDLKMSDSRDRLLKIESVRTDDWPSVVLKSRADGFDAVIDCKQLRDQRPTTDLDLQFIAVPSRSQEIPFSEWHSDSDELEQNLGKTLGLRWFIEQVILTPDDYGIELEPMMRVQAHESQ